MRPSDNGTVGRERRRFRRIPLRLKIRLLSPLGEFDAETIDISMNGVLVRTSRILPPGSPIEVRLDFPSETKPIVGQGLVVRVIGDQMGIRVQQMSADESRRLEEHLLSVIALA